MATKSKLEFYRFTLNAKNEEVKTFRDFAIDELKAKKTCTNDEAFIACFNHFIKSMAKDFAKDNVTKKQIAIIDRKKVNKYHDLKPTFVAKNCVLHGVINGGQFGRDRIMSDVDDHEISEAIAQNKSVLLYFYVYAYFPSDHDEGFFMIHSNASDESVTVLFRKYISHLFKGTKYNKAVPEAFCPKSFQDEFRKGAVLKSMMFKTTVLDKTNSADAITQILQHYDIKIEAIPKRKDVSVNAATKFLDVLKRKLFGSKDNTKPISDFNTKLNAQNEVTKATKVFEWNAREAEFVPVVYLEGRLDKFNADGTPDFTELHKLCGNLFKNEILKEIRPDLFTKKG